MLGQFQTSFRQVIDGFKRTFRFEVDLPFSHVLKHREVDERAPIGRNIVSASSSSLVDADDIMEFIEDGPSTESRTGGKEMFYFFGVYGYVKDRSSLPPLASFLISHDLPVTLFKSWVAVELEG